MMMLTTLFDVKHRCCELGDAVMLLSDEDEDGDDVCGGG